MHLARFVKVGGIVAFHDSGIDYQEQCKQWDGKPVQVRRFLQDIGVLDDKLPGWKLLADDKDNINGITFIQRVGTPDA